MNCIIADTLLAVAHTVHYEWHFDVTVLSSFFRS